MICIELHLGPSAVLVLTSEGCVTPPSQSFLTVTEVAPKLLSDVEYTITITIFIHKLGALPFCLHKYQESLLCFAVFYVSLICPV